MNRSYSMIKNIAWELGYYIIVVLLGFLAPRFIILTYGSSVNGLSSAITQILNVILLLQAGATTAAMYHLYKPIEDNDLREIRYQYSAASKYFKRLSIIFLIIMSVSACIVPFVLKADIEKIYIFSAFCILGLKSFLDLLFTSKYRILFTAYQEKYLISISTLFEQVIYYCLVFVTIYFKWHFIFIYLWFFVGCFIKVLILVREKRRKHPEIYEVTVGESKNLVPGTGYSLANEVSHSITMSSISILIAFLYGLKESSVYSVYALVFAAIDLISLSLYSSFAPSFANLVASSDTKRVSEVFSIFQFLFALMSTFFMMSCTYLLIPFVKLYTSGATDINYISIQLASLYIVLSMCSSYRIPYNLVVSSSGFFKQTWRQPVICAVISIAISICLGHFNFAYILCGPIVFYICNFFYQRFVLRKLAPHTVSKRVFLLILISIISLFCSYLFSIILPVNDGISAWILHAILFVVFAVIILLVLSYLFMRKEFNMAYLYLVGILHHS